MCRNEIAGNLITSCCWQHAQRASLGFISLGEITVPSWQKLDPGAHLCVGVVALDSRSAIVWSGRLDPFQHGVSIFLGKTGNQLCPVTTLAVYLNLMEPAGALFHFRDSRPLSCDNLLSSRSLDRVFFFVLTFSLNYINENLVLSCEQDWCYDTRDFESMEVHQIQTRAEHHFEGN